MFAKLRRVLGSCCRGFGDWIRTSGLGVFWIALIVMAVILGIAALLGLVAGMVVGIPALVLYLAFNAVVPAFGGPVIGYWTAVGLTILIPIVIRLLHGRK